MTIRPIRDPAEGERVLAVEPPIAPTVDPGWRRRLHLFTGRALSDVALAAEQEGRAGRLAAAGRVVSHGVVNGLEVGIERVDEPVPPADRRNPDAWPYWTPESAPTPEPAAVPRWYVHVAPGQGIAASGEDVKVPRALRIPLDLLWVYLTPPSGSSPSAEAMRTGVAPELRLPPELRAVTKTGLLSSVLAARSAAEALGTAVEAPLRTAVSTARLPGVSVHASTPLRAPVVAPPDFRGPLWTLRRDGAPLPRAGVLVLQPISMEVVGEADPTDPCAYDPEADAYADWQRVDGCRLVLYAWPYSWLPDPAGLTARNQIADQVFRWEAAQLPGERHPWEGKGVPLGLVGMDSAFAPLWVDSGAVVRAGGKPRRRSALVAGVGSPFLWQARLQQFAEEAAETDWTVADAAAVLRRFRWVPPAGLLPRAAADAQGRPRHLFPDHWMVDAAPVPVEHLDAAIEASAPLEPFDLASPAPDRLRVLVPVPEAWFEPRLLKTEEVAPEFQDAVDTFVARRTELLRRREDLGEKAGALVEAYTGRRPELRPDLDPGRLEEEDLTTPNPYSGRLAHESPLAAGPHGHGFRGGTPLPVLPGEKLFTYVFPDPSGPPTELRLRWVVTDWQGPRETPTAYWAAAPDAARGEGWVYAGPLPEAGRWSRLEVPAHRVGAETLEVTGADFEAVDGRVIWDRAGKVVSTDQVWMNNGGVPRGAVRQPDEWSYNDEWGVDGYGVFYVEAPADQYAQNLFQSASAVLPVEKDDVLVAYVQLERDTPPPEAVMLQWYDGSWEHRAYWGEDRIPLGTPGTASRRYMGPLPAPGEWARLEVPAAAVGLEGRILSGMAFTVFGGRVMWNLAGVVRNRVLTPGTGLHADYFEDDAFQQPILARVDAEVGYTGESPGRSVRWTGQLVPRFTESHNFRAWGYGTARLWVDGELVLQMEPHPSGYLNNASGNVDLVAGREYAIRVEHVAAADKEKNLHLDWSSANQSYTSLPTARLHPPSMAGRLKEGPPPEVVWLEDALPPQANPHGEGEGWVWISAPPLAPPEDDYRTLLEGETCRAVPLLELKRELRSNSPLTPDDQMQLERLGLERFVADLDARVRTADDWVDFGFLRVQADMYRIRQLMLGTTAATRLATSPALAAVVRAESALTVREGILDFLKQSKLAPAPADGSVLMAADSAAGAASLSASEPAEPSATLALDASFLSTSLTAGFAAARPAAAVTYEPSIAYVAPRETLSEGIIYEPRVGTSFPSPTTEPVTAFPTASPTAFTPITLSPLRLGGTDLSAVIGKQPIIGNAHDFRTVTVGERMETPPANEAHSYAKSTRFEVLDGLNRLAISLDDLPIPGFVRMVAGAPDYRKVTTTGSGTKTLQVPVREPRRWRLVRYQLPDLVLGEKDPPDADETIFFNVAVELLDATTAGLRVVEGRVQQYRQVLERCRAVLAELHGLATQIDRRIKTVEDELSEARHDVAVSRALLAEETERVGAINERRATILREHVHFLAFHRPRLAHADAEVPVRALNPAYTPASVPACLADTTGAPPELRSLLEMLREAPVRWFPAVRPLVDQLDRPDVLLGTLQTARIRARAKQEPQVLETTEGRRGGQIGLAINRRLHAQRTVVGEWRRTLAEVDLGRFRGQGWQWMRDRAVQVLSLGDLIDASHGRSKVDRGATRELDDVLRVATCLYRRFGEVLPSLRLEWAERLSQHDEPVELRSLYSLPRWGEVPYVDGREMQAQVDWLYGRVDPREPQATALVSDLVRVCLLLASHAPVDQIVAGTVERQTEVKAGGTVPLVVDLGRVRIGMPVLVYDDRKRPVKGVVEDVAGGVAVTRIVQTPGRATVTLPEGARVQLGESVSVGAAPRPEDRGSTKEAARERTLERLEQRRRRYDTRSAARK